MFWNYLPLLFFVTSLLKTGFLMFLFVLHVWGRQKGVQYQNEGLRGMFMLGYVGPWIAGKTWSEEEVQLKCIQATSCCKLLRRKSQLKTGGWFIHGHPQIIEKWWKYGSMQTKPEKNNSNILRYIKKPMSKRCSLPSCCWPSTSSCSDLTRKTQRPIESLVCAHCVVIYSIGGHLPRRAGQRPQIACSSIFLLGKWLECSSALLNFNEFATIVSYFFVHHLVVHGQKRLPRHTGMTSPRKVSPKRFIVCSWSCLRLSLLYFIYTFVVTWYSKWQTTSVKKRRDTVLLTKKIAVIIPKYQQKAVYKEDVFVAHPGSFF